MTHKGVFVEIYGDTLVNRVLEYFLENQDLDVAVGDLAEDTDISRPKAYEIIAHLEKKGYVIPSRIIGRTQLYKINKENKRVQLLMRIFLEGLKVIAEEYTEKGRKKVRSAKVVLVSAKRDKNRRFTHHLYRE